MAQAARLNLRMQKELKLLLTDPPPGVSLPMLSGDSDLSFSSSLSTIHAQDEGPEGTVYAKGFFNITIQIPEKYPFQPPNVTFATPIYHPNIDNGGRICLDILNLPPKGAWQPSLNISTVLTSIGLLVSDPNPGDGLMCEVSREYKYNKQTFDQRARSMTERYAKAGAIGNCSNSESISTNPMPNLIEVKGPDVESKDEGNEYKVSHKKLRGISRKLSLDSSDPSQRNDGNEMASVVPNQHPFLPNSPSQTEINEKNTKTKGINEFSKRYRLSEISRKLSLESMAPSQKRGDDDKENMLPNCQLLHENSQNLSMASSKSFPVPQACNCNEQRPHQHFDRNAGNENIKMWSKKPLLESSDLYQKSLPMPKICERDELQYCQDPDGETGNALMSMSHKNLCSNDQKLPQGSSDTSQSRDDGYEASALRTHKLSLLQSKRLSMALSTSHMMPQCGKSGEQQPPQDHNLDRKKLLLESLSKFQIRDAKGSKLSTLHPQSVFTVSSGSLIRANNHDKQQSHQDCNQETTGKIKRQGGEASSVIETVIVLDSEDSEEEAKGPISSRLSLSQRRFGGGGGEWKTKVLN